MRQETKLALADVSGTLPIFQTIELFCTVLRKGFKVWRTSERVVMEVAANCATFSCSSGRESTLWQRTTAARMRSTCSSDHAAMRAAHGQNSPLAPCTVRKQKPIFPSVLETV